MSSPTPSSRLSALHLAIDCALVGLAARVTLRRACAVLAVVTLGLRLAMETVIGTGTIPYSRALVGVVLAGAIFGLVTGFVIGALAGRFAARRESPSA